MFSFVASFWFFSFTFFTLQQQQFFSRLLTSITSAHLRDFITTGNPRWPASALHQINIFVKNEHSSTSTATKARKKICCRQRAVHVIVKYHLKKCESLCVERRLVHNRGALHLRLHWCFMPLMHYRCLLTLLSSTWTPVIIMFKNNSLRLVYISNVYRLQSNKLSACYSVRC